MILYSLSGKEVLDNRQDSENVTNPTFINLRQDINGNSETQNKYTTKIFNL